MIVDNGPNFAANPDDVIRHEHLTNLLNELGNPDAVWMDGVTPIVDYYLQSVRDPNSMVSRLPYNEETGIPKGGIYDMKYGDVEKVKTLGKDFLTPDRHDLAIIVGFRAIALMREPILVDGKTSGTFAHNNDWISYLKNN